MKKLIFIVCVYAANITLLAQKHEFLKMPKLTVEDLKKSKSGIDEKAPTEILYRSVHYRVDPYTAQLVKKYAYRVKIYDKDKSEDWLNLEIPLEESSSGSKESLNSIKAYVYNLENDKIEETKIDKSSKFKSKENKYVTINKFAFPNIKNGSVIEYQYEVFSPFIYEIPLIYIELNTPSLYTEYVLDSPSNMSYHVDFTGNLIPKYRNVGNEFLYGSDSKTYRFAYENVKGFKTEKFVKNNDNYRTKLRAELHSIFVNNTLKNFTSTWEDIRKTLWDHENFGMQYKKNKLPKDLLPKTISQENDQLKKANAIFDFVKNTFTWNQMNGFYTENGIKEFAKTKTGNTGDLNLMLINAMRSEGLKAYPILISTVRNGLVNLSFPNIGNFNYVIAAVQIDKNTYLYDATSKQSKEGILPGRVWNSNGLILKDEKAEVISLNNIRMSHVYKTMKAKIDDDGMVTGIYEDRDHGLLALNAKESYDENPDNYKKQYKENFSVDFSEVQPKVLEDGNFESTMKFTSNNMIDNIGKKKIINPLLFLHQNSSDFDQQEERKYMIDFISPISTTKTVEIEIPEGYDVVDLPKSKKIVTDDKEISYSYVVEKKGNKIVTVSSYKIASADYPKEYYPAFKQIWKVISDSENQVMSLIKK
nr:transglutaminase domain-containing protein [uncultured Chryseobacterium sp.]